MRAAASFSSPQPSASSSNANAVPTNQPLTIDGLLATYTDSSNPTLAALEAAVNERNSLSAQNTQLWKLIEKQRSGYNHVMKELERLRGERDLYKHRLQDKGEDTDRLLRAHRAREKAEGKDASLRSTASSSQLKPSESNGSSSSSRPSNTLDTRGQMLRTHSDESRQCFHSPHFGVFN